MSRAALWKQEGKVQERERRAETVFEEAVEEGRARSTKSTLPLWGPDDSFHFNPLLLQNTIRSPYFQKGCETLKDWNAVVDEIYYEVKHLLPFHLGGKSPSTAFCLLLRLLLLRVTPHQLDLTLKHADSPYIRCIGFLYLRYAGQPERAWEWIGPYVHDDEPVQVQPGNKPGSEMTVGEYVRRLFSDREYYGTPLPRFPVLVERELRARILQAESVAERAKQHYKNASRLRHFETLGSKVMALYGDDDNPVEWYEAVVDRVIRTDEDGHALTFPKYVVTYIEYDNTETVQLGEMDVLDGDWKTSRHHRGGGDGGGTGKSGGGGGDDWYEEVRRRERGTVTAGKGWAPKRPPTTKTSLSSHPGGYDGDRRGGGGGGGRGYGDDNRSSGSRSRRQDDDDGRQQQRRNHRDDNDKPPPSEEATAPPPKKRSAQELAAVEDKKRRLMAKYG